MSDPKGSGAQSNGRRNHSARSPVSQRDRTGSLPFGTKPRAINPRFFRGLLYPDPWFGRNPRQSLEVLIRPFDRPVFGPRAGRAPRATAWIDGLLSLRPPPQKSSPTVAVPHQVPQYSSGSEPKRSALTTIAADRGSLWGIRGIVTFRNFARNPKPAGDVGDPFILLHRSSPSRRGQLGLGRQHQLLGGWLNSRSTATSCAMGRMASTRSYGRWPISPTSPESSRPSLLTFGATVTACAMRGASADLPHWFRCCRSRVQDARSPNG